MKRTRVQQQADPSGCAKSALTALIVGTFGLSATGAPARTDERDNDMSYFFTQLVVVFVWFWWIVFGVMPGQWY